jgi:hypothetical protein
VPIQQPDKLWYYFFCLGDYDDSSYRQLDCIVVLVYLSGSSIFLGVLAMNTTLLYTILEEVHEGYDIELLAEIHSDTRQEFDDIVSMHLNFPFLY